MSFRVTDLIPIVKVQRWDFDEYFKMAPQQLKLFIYPTICDQSHKWWFAPQPKQLELFNGDLYDISPK